MYKKKLKTLITCTERQYYDNRFRLCCANMKKTWQTINKIINKPMNSAINFFFTTDSGIIADGK